MEFSKLIFRFEKELVNLRYSKQSILCYKSCVIKFLDYHNEYPQRINTEEIKDYIYELTILSCSPEKIIQVISSLKKFYSLIIKQPQKLNSIKNPKVGEKLIKPLSISQIKKLIDSFENIKHKAIIQVMYSGGLRISELLNLKWCDLHRDRKLMFIKNAKGGNDRFVPLYPETIEILEEYWRYGYKTKGRIFHGQNKDIYSASSIRQFLKKQSESIGLNSVYPHLCRHSFLTHLHEKGLSLRTIQKIAGHKNSKTTERYTKVSNKEIGNIIYPLSA